MKTTASMCSKCRPIKFTSKDDSADFVVSGLPLGLTLLALMFCLEMLNKVDNKVDRLPQCHITKFNMSITRDLPYFVN